ncbi:hypothetical protein H4219_000163 [Mycoemilia scoparia]|uniref:Protein YIPF n=1 Tax=Mycoemilia scoparia TaxID=417184 RepID=A0A9W8DXS6_9FUNG|nr:hypothetical protein H4219_000163 [Mycoemilia scoparia]
MQAPAHSVLFDSGDANTDGFGQNAGDGMEMYGDLDFEPMQYTNEYEQPNTQGDISGGVNDFYNGGYTADANGIPPLVERSWLAAFGTGGFPNEPPLLEAVLNPFRKIDTHIYDDTDMAGPLLFILLLGTLLLLTGKSQFGYIYGVALFGCLSIYAILNMMSMSGIDVARTASILGYCLLPLVSLSGIGLLINLK